MAHLDLDQLVRSISALSAERSADEARLTEFIEENRELHAMVKSQRAIITELEAAAVQMNDKLIPFFDSVAANLKTRVAIEGLYIP